MPSTTSTFAALKESRARKDARPGFEFNNPTLNMLMNQQPRHKSQNAPSENRQELVKRMEAADFVKRIQREKADRRNQVKMMTRAKDEQFLQKMKETIDIRERQEARKKKDREMRHSLMMKKIENKR